MGLLDRAIKSGINRAVGNVVAGAVEKAVAPKVEQAAEQVAQQIVPPPQPTAQIPAPDPAITQQQAQATQTKSDNAMAEWDRMLPQYPKWQFGGYDYRIDRLEDYEGAPYYKFSAYGVGQAELERYRQLLLTNGFHPAGKYPDQSHLFKRIDGVVYNADLEHAFESDGLALSFTVREPNGGFDYVKPQAEQKPKSGGLFG
jgi:hypothetical protein